MNRVQRAFRFVGPKRLAVSIVSGVILVVLVSWAIDVHDDVHPLSRAYGAETRTHHIIHWRASGDQRLISLIDEYPDYATVWTGWVSPDTHEMFMGWYPNRQESTTLPHWCKEDWPAYTGTTPDPAVDAYLEDAAGWPMYALSHSLSAPSNSSGVVWHDTLTLPSNLIPGLHGQSDITLPIRILWTGFLFNVLCYTLAVYPLVTAWHTIRTVHRRTKGRCPACGYSLEGLATNACPECGRTANTAHPARRQGRGTRDEITRDARATNGRLPSST